jgi:predicted ATPase
MWLDYQTFGTLMLRQSLKWKRKNSDKHIFIENGVQILVQFLSQ